jgi:uncharacterized repeat protein (TIGR03803 family)
VLCGLALSACSRGGGTLLPVQPALDQQLSAGSTLMTLYSFGRKSDDGRAPDARLLADGANLYGTTSGGGITTGECTTGCGTIFAVTAGGDEKTVYRFRGGADGSVPLAGLIAVDGALFGTTSSGGGSARCPGGCGTVFKVTPGGKEEIIYRFAGGTNGAQPVAGLKALDGALYGTTEYGGARTHACFQGCGTIFRLSPNGESARIVYRFKGGADGAQPAANLIAVDGALYGTTRYGGGQTSLCATGCGTVFRVSKDGAERIVHRFAYKPNSDEGAFPAAGLIAFDGALYGTTVGGGTEGSGTVFRASASGTERTIYSFACCGLTMDGRVPDAALIGANGRLFGTTASGGTGGRGTIFNVTTAGTERVIYRFTGRPGGAHPQATLVDVGAALYGTTVGGGALGEGTVFRLML